MALPRKYRIVGEKDFNRVFRYGKIVSGKGVLAKVFPNSLERLRFGVAVSSKKFPLAATRNKIKRATFSQLIGVAGSVAWGYDIVFIPQSISQPTQEIDRIIQKIVGSHRT